MDHSTPGDARQPDGAAAGEAGSAAPGAGGAPAGSGTPGAGGSPEGGGRAAALTVPCHVSERWLRFAEREQYAVLDEDLIQLDVMTRDDDGAPYKLCELMVSRGDLLRAVAAYGDPPLRRVPVRKDGMGLDSRQTAATRGGSGRVRRVPPPRDAEQTEL
jgi:hypothetical protein